MPIDPSYAGRTYPATAAYEVGIEKIREFADAIVHTVAGSHQKLDAGLVDVTDNWRLERIGAIERCVLRLGAAELERRETPPRVVIQEAVRLAERFGSTASARFVNGVLDAYARRAGIL